MVILLLNVTLGCPLRKEREENSNFVEDKKELENLLMVVQEGKKT